MTDINGFARLGENPKLKFVPGKQPNETRGVAEFRLCLLNFRKRGEDYDDRGLWVDASLWDEQAELVARHLKKGDKIYIVGDLSAGHWTDKETGEARSKPELHINNITLDIRTLESFRMKPRAAKPEPTDQENQASARSSDPEMDRDIPFHRQGSVSDQDQLPEPASAVS